MEHHLKIKNKLNVTISRLLSAFIILSMLYALWNIRDILLSYKLEDILIKYKERSNLIYFFVCFLQPIVLPLPEPITIMAGSIVFGRFNGAIIGFLGTILGIVSMFLFSRYASKKFIENIISHKKLEKFNQYIQKNETLIILLLFILPILPDEVICVGTGITKINGYKFILIAMLAKLITAFTLSYSIELFNMNPISIITSKLY